MSREATDSRLILAAIVALLYWVREVDISFRVSKNISPLGEASRQTPAIQSIYIIILSPLSSLDTRSNNAPTRFLTVAICLDVP